MSGDRVELDGATKPMALHNIAQGLVDDLTRLVIHLGVLGQVDADEVPEPLRDLYEQCRRSEITS